MLPMKTNDWVQVVSFWSECCVFLLHIEKMYIKETTHCVSDSILWVTSGNFQN